MIADGDEPRAGRSSCCSSGDAGVGKSRLASEVGDVARERARRARAHRPVRAVRRREAFGPVAEALRDACGIDGLRHDEARRRVVQTVIATLGSTAHALDDADTESAPEIEPASSKACMYLMEGIDASRRRPEPRPRRRHLRAPLAFLEALRARTPLVLGALRPPLGDRRTVLELCDRLLARLRNLPVRARRHRPARHRRTLVARARQAQRLALHLDPLDRAATARARARAVRRLTPTTRPSTFLLERSGGNPFFVEELVAFVQESSAGATRDGLRELPATLHGLVAARLDALEPAERSLLEDCAVVGGSGPIAAVLALADRADAPAPARAARRARPPRQLDDDDFHFKSELIREIAYGTLTKAERARRHAVARAGARSARRTRGRPGRATTSRPRPSSSPSSGAVPGVPADVREQAVDALHACAPTAPRRSSRGSCPGRHHDRALGLLGARSVRAALERAARPRPGRACSNARSTTAATTRSSCSTRRGEAGERPVEAAALTLLGEACTRRAAPTTRPKQTLAEALQEWRELGDDSGVADVLRELGMSHLFRGDLVQAERFVSEALAAYRNDGNRRGEAWALQNLAWISFSRGDIAHRREAACRESAELFGELGDWGGLGWAYGLLAFVRYNQGRLDEAAELAEHIAVEGRETGNRWAVGMMDVLLANVALWSGRTRESGPRGPRSDRSCSRRSATAGARSRRPRRWSARSPSSANGRNRKTALVRMREVAATLVSEGMQHIPEVVQANIFLQYGHPDEAAAAAEPARSRAAWRSGTAIATPRTDCSSCSSVASTTRSCCSNRSTPRRSTTAPR